MFKHFVGHLFQIQNIDMGNGKCGWIIIEWSQISFNRGMFLALNKEGKL